MHSTKQKPKIGLIMKKLLLLAVTAAVSTMSFAQKSGISQVKGGAFTNEFQFSSATPGAAAKTTAVGDTLGLTHFGTGDTITLYYATGDSGYVAGTDAFEDKGFAERYDFKASDSTLKVIGVIARFGGRINPASTKAVTFNVWAQGPKAVSFRPTIFNNGLPAASLASKIVPITQLGIGLADTAADTTKAHYFPTATSFLSDSFFVGYTINYTWAGLAGDTIGLYSNQDGERSEPGYFAISTSDTTINNVNVTQYADNTWHDNNVENFSLFNNLMIFPIVVVGPGIGAVGGVTKNDLTFLGNYPNPATNSTNIKFALAQQTDVTVEIMDLNGRSIRQVSRKSLSAGEHFIPVNTADLPAGEYLYLVRTGTGNGMASKMIIIR
jgi:hypothetical protein